MPEAVTGIQAWRAKSIASHVAQRGIRANMVSRWPAWAVLNLAGQRFPDDRLTDLGSSTPLVRVAQSAAPCR